MENAECNNIFDSNRLSHAYITTDAVSENIAMAVVCGSRTGARPCMNCSHCDKAMRHIHPDITVIDKFDDKREILVDQIRDLKKDVYIIPNEAEQKAYIVRNADSMNRNAQNAFLQMLEEPPSHAVFILCTMSPVTLLPTVRSRCLELKTLPGMDALYLTGSEEADELATTFLTAIGNNTALMEFMFRLEKLDKNTFPVFLTSAREHIAMSLREDITLEKRKSLVHAEGILIKADEMLALNVNAGHIAGMICAGLIEMK